MNSEYFGASVARELTQEEIKSVGGGADTEVMTETDYGNGGSCDAGRDYIMVL